MIMAHFKKYGLFLGWFQVMSVVFWFVSGSFLWVEEISYTKIMDPKGTK